MAYWPDSLMSVNMPFKEQLIAACTDKAKTLGRKLQSMEIVELACECHVKATKERKKAEVLPESEQVFNAYPRRSGGEAALRAISKAIRNDGFEAVLDGTLEFAAAVARWPQGRRVSQSGQSLIPMPSTFYDNRRYALDDRKTWWEGTGKAEKEEKQAALLAEPQGWRFAHPESRFVTENISWAAIDLASQKWIIANTPKKERTA